MTEDQIARRILDAAFIVHTKLGPGVFESVYEVALAHELRKTGVEVQRQKPMSVVYDGITFDEAFRSDLVVERKSCGRTRNPLKHYPLCTPNRF